MGQKGGHLCVVLLVTLLSVVCNYSLSWLKHQYRRLGLKRRCVDPTAGEIRALIQVYLFIYLFI